MMDDNELRSRLSNFMEAPAAMEPPVENTDYVSVAAEDVMRSYQNANKWLDTIKESLLMDHGCVFFSTYIHNLAHTMPVRFDKFGDILHTCDMKVPYPETERYAIETQGIEEIFQSIFSILGSIKASLRNFIKSTDGTDKHGMACAAEALLNDIEGEYPALYRMRRGYNYANGDIIKFDKWVNQYMNNSGSILG